MLTTDKRALGASDPMKAYRHCEYQNRGDDKVPQDKSPVGHFQILALR
jgi:hypothetical protein